MRLGEIILAVVNNWPARNLSSPTENQVTGRKVSRLGSAVFGLLFVLVPGWSFATKQIAATSLETNRAVTGGDLRASLAGRAGKRGVTQREAQIGAALEQWFLLRDSSGRSKQKLLFSPSWLPSPGSEAFRAAVGRSLTEVVVNLEADRFGLAPISVSLVQNTAKDFLLVAGSSRAWQEMGVSTQEVETLVLRRLRTAAFLRQRTEAEGIQITDVEILEFYEKNRARFGDLPLSSLRESIRESLTRTRQEERLKDWFESLRRKYNVRMLRIPSLPVSPQVPASGVTPREGDSSSASGRSELTSKESTGG